MIGFHRARQSNLKHKTINKRLIDDNFKYFEIEFYFTYNI